MRSCLITVGIMLMACVSLQPQARASLECEDNEFVCKCEQAWSAAFDGVIDYIIDQELSHYLSQNQVSAADITSGFRTLSVRNRCMLGVMCKAVEYGAAEERMKNVVSPDNFLGGGFPGTFASCASGVTFEDVFNRMENGSELLAGIRKDCSFLKEQAIVESESVEEGSEEDDIIQESINMRIAMVNLCDTHLEVSAAIFDRTISNMIRKDTTRKVIGHFSKKIFSIVQRLQLLQEKAQAFATNTNGAMNLLCTLSNPD